MTSTLRVNPIACSGHGLCAELLPELIALDEWGYPVIADGPVPAGLTRQARRAVTDCPALALALAPEPEPGRAAPIRPGTGRSGS
ncbi:MAG TPA: ferredoxin [Streptosporangiaceae bacterium]|nr:ferredoxin [Streptosporangiaceae bacterium]